MKSYTLLPILCGIGSVTCGVSQGFSQYSESLSLGAVAVCSFVCGLSSLSYFDEHPRRMPVSWNEDPNASIRFGVILGGVGSAAGLATGYGIGRACALGIERLL